jgi:glycosyltransferase involved in cell wall biosynthesis
LPVDFEQQVCPEATLRTMNYSIPRITVLMPVYNTAAYLREAIESILNQNFGDFELLIIDDASTDDSFQIASSYTDPRVQVVRKPANSGYTDSLNQGLQLARGEYIARMDSDDISDTERFRKQVEFMDAHPEIGLCGTWVEAFGAINEIWRTETEHESIRAQMLFFCPVTHPTVLIRKAVLAVPNLCYNRAFEPAEDYDLWERLLQHCQLANLPEVLLRYRVHEKQVSATKASRQAEGVNIIIKRQLKKLNITPTETQLRLHLSLTEKTARRSAAQVVAIHEWLAGLLHANKQLKVYDQHVFAYYLNSEWEMVFYNAAGFSRELLGVVRGSPFGLFQRITPFRKLIFGLKCFLNYEWAPLRLSRART